MMGFDWIWTFGQIFFVPQPITQSKLEDCLFHVLDNGDVIVCDVDSDRAGGEEDQGLHQRLSLHEQSAFLLLRQFKSSS